MSGAVEKLRERGGLVMTIGIALMIIALGIFIAPAFVETSITTVAGLLLLVVGVVRVFYAVRSKGWGEGNWGLVIGLLALITGGLILLQPVTGMYFLTFLLAAFFFADGLIRSVLAFRLREFNGWIWTLFSAFGALLMGFVILKEWPLSGERAIGILLGIHILLSGWALVALGMGIRSAHKTKL